MGDEDELSSLFTVTGKRWDGIRKLGEGGQGTVYLVRRADARSRRGEALGQIGQALRERNAAPDWSVRLANAIATYTAVDPPNDLGALKIFNVRKGSSQTQAEARFRREIEALRMVTQRDDKGIIRLIDADDAGQWMVTEYLSAGTLENARNRFTGNVSATFRAFRSLVSAVASLHDAEQVHRDIKPANIFIGSDGGLVLGDFGIVFYEDTAGARPTETQERVGPRDWMPPWANTGQRIDEVKPSVDVYMLGKVLWWMLSGRYDPYWWFRRDSYNLEKLFPDEHWMRRANSILDRCVVDDEERCLPRAGDLLALIDDELGALARGGRVLGDDVKRWCRVCGRGSYGPAFGIKPEPRVLTMPTEDSIKQVDRASQIIDVFRPSQPYALRVRPYVCNRCGHIELFSFQDGIPPGWQADGA